MASTFRKARLLFFFVGEDFEVHSSGALEVARALSYGGEHVLFKVTRDTLSVVVGKSSPRQVPGVHCHLAAALQHLFSF